MATPRPSGCLRALITHQVQTRILKAPALVLDRTISTSPYPMSGCNRASYLPEPRPETHLCGSANAFASAAAAAFAPFCCGAASTYAAASPAADASAGGAAGEARQRRICSFRPSAALPSAPASFRTRFTCCRPFKGTSVANALTCAVLHTRVCPWYECSGSGAGVCQVQHSDCLLDVSACCRWQAACGSSTRCVFVDHCLCKGYVRTIHAGRSNLHGSEATEHHYGLIGMRRTALTAVVASLAGTSVAHMSTNSSTAHRAEASVLSGKP